MFFFSLSKFKKKNFMLQSNMRFWGLGWCWGWGCGSGRSITSEYQCWFTLDPGQQTQQPQLPSWSTAIRNDPFGWESHFSTWDELLMNFRGRVEGWRKCKFTPLQSCVLKDNSLNTQMGLGGWGSIGHSIMTETKWEEIMIRVFTFLLTGQRRLRT